MKKNWYVKEKKIVRQVGTIRPKEVASKTTLEANPAQLFNNTWSPYLCTTTGSSTRRINPGCPHGLRLRHAMHSSLSGVIRKFLILHPNPSALTKDVLSHLPNSEPQWLPTIDDTYQRSTLFLLISMESMEPMEQKVVPLSVPGPLIATGGGSWFVIVCCNGFHVLRKK